jgi:hypothetical protein
MKKPRPITNILSVTGDHHCGGTTALCPPRVTLDDGAEYVASEIQRWLYEHCWKDYWRQVGLVVDAEKKHATVKHYEVFLGDLTEGNHHGTTQILSGNSAAQAQVVNAIMRVPLALNPDGLIGIRGTEAHVGKSAEGEEKIWDGLARDKRPVVRDLNTGTASWWHFYGYFGRHLVDITHHGRTGLREHTRGGAAVLYAHDILLSYVKRGEIPPDLALRGHYHRFNDSYDACPTRFVQSGAWQLATSHVHKVAPDSLADIGGLICILREEGPPEVRKISYPPARGKIWQAVE